MSSPSSSDDDAAPALPPQESPLNHLVNGLQTSSGQLQLDSLAFPSATAKVPPTVLLEMLRAITSDLSSNPSPINNRLPTEIVSRIFELVCGDECQSDEDHEVCTRTLYSAGLVCRRWTKESRRVLHRDVRIGTLFRLARFYESIGFKTLDPPSLKINGKWTMTDEVIDWFDDEDRDLPFQCSTADEYVKKILAGVRGVRTLVLGGPCFKDNKMSCDDEYMNLEDCDLFFCSNLQGFDLSVWERHDTLPLPSSMHHLQLEKVRIHQFYWEEDDELLTSYEPFTTARFPSLSIHHEDVDCEPLEALLKFIADNLQSLRSNLATNTLFSLPRSFLVSLSSPTSSVSKSPAVTTILKSLTSLLSTLSFTVSQEDRHLPQRSLIGLFTSIIFLPALSNLKVMRLDQKCWTKVMTGKPLVDLVEVYGKMGAKLEVVNSRSKIGPFERDEVDLGLKIALNYFVARSQHRPSKRES